MSTMFKKYARRPLTVMATQYWPMMKIEGVENVKRQVFTQDKGKNVPEEICTWGKIVRIDGNGIPTETIVYPADYVIKNPDGSFEKIDYMTFKKDFDDEPI
jgi:hypothetical protein